MAKKQTICEKVYILKDGSEARSASGDVARLEFRFANDQIIAITEDDLNDAVRRAAMWHGLAQKIGDSYASAIDAEEAAEKAQAVRGQISGETGQWTVRGGGGGSGKVTVLALAIAEVQGLDASDVEETLKAMDKEQKKQLRKHPRIAAVVARIEAERAAEKAQRAAKAAAGAGAEDALAAFGFMD